MRYREILLEKMSWDEAVNIFKSHGIDPATTPDLKKAWRQLMKQKHPDAGGADDPAKLINAAYDILKNPKQAEPEQDRSWTNPTPRRPPPDPRTEYADRPAWSWAGYSGGMPNSAHIYREDYRDHDYIKKRMWELSGQSNEEWSIEGFDGSYMRHSITVYGSPKIFRHMAEAMIIWQTKGGNAYPCRAVLVQKRKSSSPKTAQQQGDDSQTMHIIWADGVFYDRDPIPIEYDSFNRNASNDRSFNNRLKELLDNLAENGRNHNKQSSMNTGAEQHYRMKDLEAGYYVFHKKHGVGRVINPEIRKGMVRVAFKNGTGNVKLLSLRPAKDEEIKQYNAGKPS